MHLNFEEIIRFIDNKLDKDKMRYAKNHLSDCEYCQEIYEQTLLTAEKYKEFLNQDYSEEHELIKEKLNNHIPLITIIPLRSFSNHSIDSTHHLAADGIQEEQVPIQIISTFFSEDPEVIVKLVKDKNLNEDYILVISENNEIMSNVLVELPDLGKHYLTDQKGKALVDDLKLEDLTKEKMQVKLPDVVFDLKPLDYSPDKTESSNEFILTTENNDKIKVVIEDKTVGKNIHIQLTELNGEKELNDIKISIVQDDFMCVEKVNSHSKVSFNLKEGANGINIRIFS